MYYGYEGRPLNDVCWLSDSDGRVEDLVSAEESLMVRRGRWRQRVVRASA